MSKSNRKSVTLSTNAAAFDAAAHEAEVAQEALALELAAQANMAEVAIAPADAVTMPAEVEVMVVNTEVLPATDTPESFDSREGQGDVVEVVEPEVRRHMTNFIKGERRNGVGVPAINGLCHEAWRLFDRMTEWHGDEVRVVALVDAVAAGVAVGLNKGNLKIEYPNWRKFNGFPAVTRKAGA